MKPIKLTIRAFGPYAGEQVIDFRELGGRSFFLIHGPTGAGKTTILDAICYALYGDTSGAERKGEQMRSQHADPAVSTEVSFDFALGKDTYRATRSPEQERPRKRGSGTTTQQMTATLWQRTGLNEDAEEGSVLAAQPSKVTEHVERLFGFSSDQFRQVVMLPQDKFRELLSANSVEREGILEALFGTEVYSRIQEALKQKAQDTHQYVKIAQEKRQLVLEQSEATTIADLDVRKAKSDGELVLLKQRLSAFRLAAQKADVRFNQAKQDNVKLKEQDEARKALELLENGRAANDQRQGALSWAKKAASMSAVESTLNLRTDDVQTRTSELDIAVKAAATAKAEKEVAIRQFTLRQEKQAERDGLASELTRLRDFTDKVAALSNARRVLSEAKTLAAGLTAEYTKTKSALDGIQPQIDAKATALAKLKEKAASLDGAKLAEAQAESNLKNRRELDALQKKLVEAETKHRGSISALDQARKAAAVAKKAHAQFQKAWIEGQAAILAMQLAPGQPCFVCGSKDHPSPAKSGHELPDEAAIKAKLGEFEDAEQAVATASEAERVLAQGLLEFKTQRKSLQESLGALADEPVKVLADRQTLAKGQRQTTATAVQQIPIVEKAIHDLQQELLKTRTKAEKIDLDRQKANDKAGQAAGIVEGQEAGLPEQHRDPAALASAIKVATATLKSQQDAFEKAQTRLTEAEKGFAASTTQLTNAEGSLKTASELQAAARTEFNGHLAQAGFADQEAYKQAKRTPPEISALEMAITQFEQNLRAANDRHERAKQEAMGLVSADIKALEKALGEANTGVETAIANEATLVGTVTQIKQWIDALKTLEEELQRLEKEYSTFGRLSEVANGKNARGITLQRFVLSWLLDDVLDAATIRLRTMSRGRYQLQRMKERISLRSASGLDVEVFDGHTGMSRSVATLSGGETFLASLALALGLADVVQAYSGGVRLDTMFVDEGFGSLDPESLDLAIRSLIDLQKGGRLVGIISHVPELTERIDARLQITADRQGSSARFVMA